MEIGPSDFHKKILAMMKMHSPKVRPRVIQYHNYKLFNSENFISSLKKELNRQRKILGERGTGAFSEIYNIVHDKNATMK